MEKECSRNTEGKSGSQSVFCKANHFVYFKGRGFDINIWLQICHKGWGFKKSLPPLGSRSKIVLPILHNCSVFEAARDPASVLAALEQPYHTIIAFRKSRSPHYFLCYSNQ